MDSFLGQARAMRAPLTDLSLVERCRTDDDAAFGEVVTRYKAKIYNYVYRMTGSADDAEDLTQEVFIRMYTSIDTFRGQSSLNTWLFRIAGNLCIDRFRRTKNRVPAFSLDEPPGDETGTLEVADETYAPHRLFENAEMAEQIQAALSKLPDKLRTALLLHDIEGLPYEEIAEIAGCPLGTVKSRLFNARMQLRGHLSGYLNS